MDVAHYLIARDGDPCFVTRVEAKSIADALEDMDLENGESVMVYRIIADARKVTVKDETVRRVVVE